MTCPDDNALTGFVDGALDPEATARIEAHIDGCSACRSLLADLARALDPEPAEPGAEIPAAATMDGRYLPRRVLGVGGMSVVYLGFDTALKRRVALKVMLHAPEDVRARLRREAQALGMLSHPNVVDVYDVALSDAGAFLACEYVEGGSLRSWLAARPRTRDEILALVDDACRGLSAAHRVGLVHRDVTPNNILIGADGRGRVADFGLARLPDTQSPDSDPDRTFPSDATAKSQTGAAGTPGYMAPEVAAGTAADPRSDQYSLCATAFEALCGQLPSAAPPTGPRPALPRAIERVLRRGLAPEPAQRFGSVEALRTALAHAARPRARATARAAAVVVTGAMLSVAAWMTARPERDPCAEPARGAAVSGLDDVDLSPAVAARLQTYQQRWESSRDAACEAAQTDADTRDHDRRWVCVQTRRRALATLVAELSARGSADIAQTLRRAENLPPPEDCNDADFVRYGFAVPPPDKVADVESLAASLRTLRVRRERDGDLDAADAVDALLARAESLGHDPLTAEVMQVRGLVARDAGDIAGARQSLTASAHLAAGANAFATATWSWIILLSLEGLRAQDDEAADRVLPHLDASLQRLGNPDRLVAARAETLATIRDRQGRFEEAEPLYATALSLIGQVHSERSLKYARALGNVGIHHARRGNVAESHQHLTDALEVTRSVLGPGSPTEADCLTNLANLANMRGDSDEAIAQAERALVIWQRELPDADPRITKLLTIVGQAHAAEGRHEQAIATLSRVADLVARRDSARSPRRLDAALQLSTVLALAGRAQEAETALAPALAVIDEPGVPPALRAKIVLDHGLNLLELGQPTAARDQCQRALVGMPKGGPKRAEAQACLDEARLALAARG